MKTIEENRNLILEAASAQFLQYGYVKTTMSDVAKGCGMSPANIYRFYPTRHELVDAVAELWLQETRRLAEVIARRKGKASKRLREFVIEVHRQVRGQHTSGAKVHEICEMASRERWPAARRHRDIMTSLLAEIVRSGIESGEFADGDPDATAPVFMDALLKFHNPVLIAQYHADPLEAQAVSMAEMFLMVLGKR
ncbi:MAG: TetR/AcrR family transcriptional regulator [Parvibaculaceae bacterium]|nr:TetR/AcrR family transcriptional regulator [Parvibaculaceae bacterium]